MIGRILIFVWLALAGLTCAESFYAGYHGIADEAAPPSGR